jgi:hypothetical protein
MRKQKRAFVSALTFQKRSTLRFSYARLSTALLRLIFQMKILALVVFVALCCVVSALWFMIVEGLIAHALSKSKLRKMHSD